MSKKTGLILCAMLLAVLVLIPGQRAFAKTEEEYVKGDPCPKGCGGTLILGLINSNAHTLECNQCDYVSKEVEHFSSTGWKVASESQHYKVCDACGAGYAYGDHSGGKATCTKKAVCTKCGQEYGNSLGHDWDTEWTVEGNKHYHKCLNDGCTARNDEAEHVFDGSYIDNGDGYNHYQVCSTCGAKGLLSMHEPNRDKDIQYNYNGQYHYVPCKYCNAIIREEHYFYKWTHSDDLYHVKGCVECEYTEYQEHTGGTATCTDQAKCEVCGSAYGDPLGHNWDTKWTVEGNKHYHKCLNDGCTARSDEAAHTGGTAYCNAKAVCEVCGEEYGEVDLDNHAPGKFHPATCATPAHCDVEDRIFDDNALDPNNHEGTIIDVAGKAATCTEKGLTEGKQCSTCHKMTVEQKEIPATGHTEVIDSGKEATCTAPGLTEGKHCSVCNAVLVKQEEIPAKGHTEVKDAAVEATCTEKGKTEGSHCSVCGAVLKAQEEVPAAGHKEVTDPGIDPTCTKKGKTEGSHCEVCGKVIKEQKAIPATGHTPGEAVKENEKEPTCTKAGSYESVVYCTVCHKKLSSKVIKVPALGHQETTVPGKEPTCTEKGLTDGVKCSVCGKMLTKQKQIPALGHSYAETGRTIIRITYECERCGKSYWLYNPQSRNMLTGLVRDESGSDVPYTAGVTKEGGQVILTVTPELGTDDAKEIGLYLKPEYLVQWLAQGITHIRFERGSAVLEIEAGKITGEWFKVDEGTTIDSYVFAVTPGEDASVTVNAAAMAGDERIPADTLDGIALKAGGSSIAVAESGKYKISE